jgi:hypothetical protein
MMALTDTRLVGERKREEWLQEIARQSEAGKWKTALARQKASAGVTDAQRFGRIGPKTAKNMIAEGVLASDPYVRAHVDRLMAIRDELWATQPEYLRRTLHGPSQTLLELMRRQKRPDEQHYANDASSFLTYLHTVRFPGV